jgi:hypothetical protein
VVVSDEGASSPITRDLLCSPWMRSSAAEVDLRPWTPWSIAAGELARVAAMQVCCAACACCADSTRGWRAGTYRPSDRAHNPPSFLGFVAAGANAGSNRWLGT